MVKEVLYFKIFNLLLLVICFFAVMYWIYRPKSKTIYKKLSEIPLKEKE